MSKDFTTTLMVDKSPKQVFDAVTNPRAWWSEEIAGGTSNLDDKFHYHYKDVHTCTIQLSEVIPEKKVVWVVLDNHFSFTKDQSEWIGNKIIFDISKKGNQTQLVFTQRGLVPAYECYDICQNAWTGYIQNSLKDLITKGQGQPNKGEEITSHKVKN